MLSRDSKLEGNDVSHKEKEVEVAQDQVLCKAIDKDEGYIS